MQGKLKICVLFLDLRFASQNYMLKVTLDTHTHVLLRLNPWNTWGSADLSILWGREANKPTLELLLGAYSKEISNGYNNN